MTTLDVDRQVSREEESDETDLPPARELCWVGALLAALLLFFFLTPILRGEILSPADLLLKSDPWRQAAPPDFEPANALLSDYVFQLRPWGSLSIASLRAGRIPLWDPHNYAGAPFFANGQSAVVYPLNILSLFLRDATATLLGAMIRLFIAGLSAYIFGRVIGLSILGAAMVGVGFAFSGFLVVWLLYPIGGNVAIWLPALFLTTEIIVRRPRVSQMLALAAIVCIQFLGGHPETSIHMLAAVTLYACWRARMLLREETDWRKLTLRLTTFSGALILGTTLAAIQLLPLGEYVLESAALQDRLATATPFWFLPRPRVLAMISLVCPYCFGSHLRGDLPLGVFLGVGNFNELNGGYVGLVTFVLAGVAVVLGLRRGLDLFFLLLGGLAFCVAYAIPPVFNIVNALPLFRVSANTRLLLIFAFSTCVLAGRGIDLLLAAPQPRARLIVKRAQTILITGMAGVVIVSVSLLFVVVSFREKILEAAKIRIVAKVEQGETFRQSPEDYLALLPRYHDRLVRLLIREGTGRIVLLALTGLALRLVVKPPRGQRSLVWMLPGVLALDLFSFGRNYNPSISKELEYPSHGAIEFLRKQQGLFRVLALDGGLPPNTNVMYGLSDIRGYNALETEAFHRFLAATAGLPSAVSPVRTPYFSSFESRLTDLLNVKYLISARDLRHPKLTLVWEGGAYVYENRSVLPRAFLVYRTRVISAGRDMERALRDPAFDPQAVVLLDGEGPALSGPVDPTPMIRIVDYQPERVVIEVSSRYDGMLVLGDAWFPGWEAAVNGIPAKILRADVLLRAVAISAGNRQVIFRYNPLSFRLGLIISESALVIAVALALKGLLLRKRHDKNASSKNNEAH
jgi:hypothetical protein